VPAKAEHTPSTQERSARAAPHASADYAILLAAITATFAIEGIAEPGRWELTFLTGLLGATLLLSLTIAQARRPIVRFAWALTIGAVSLDVILALAGHTDERTSRLLGALLVALAPPAIIVGVIRRLRATQTVTVDAVIGVLCVYLLLGMFYSFVYGVVDRFGGDPFFAGGTAASVAHCMYFSFTTLSTVGYGDLTARTNLGHTLSVSEALLGQVYLVTVVSLIIANLGRRREA